MHIIRINLLRDVYCGAGKCVKLIVINLLSESIYSDSWLSRYIIAFLLNWCFYNTATESIRARCRVMGLRNKQYMMRQSGNMQLTRLDHTRIRGVFVCMYALHTTQTWWIQWSNEGWFLLMVEAQNQANRLFSKQYVVRMLNFLSAYQNHYFHSVITFYLFS